MIKPNAAQRKLAKWRQDEGLTLEEAGVEVGLSREWFRRIEAGHVVPMKHLTRCRIHDKTGIDPAAWEKKP